MNFPADLLGCGQWRLMWPSAVINNTFNKQVRSIDFHLLLGDHRLYTDTIAVRIQRQVRPYQINYLKWLKSYRDTFYRQTDRWFNIAYDVDDVIFYEDIPDYNAARGAFNDPVIRAAAIEGMQLADFITASTPYMAEYLKNKVQHDRIKVLPNHPPRFYLDRFYSFDNRLKSLNGKPSILYMGSNTHINIREDVNIEDDLSSVLPYMEATANEFNWHFFGPVNKRLKGIKNATFHDWVDLLEVPYKIQQINPTLAIAPLQDNNFNKCKSDIKLLEMAAIGIPIICQDLITYEKAILKFNNNDKLDSIIRSSLKPKRFKELVTTHHKLMDNMWLENNIKDYANKIIKPAINDWNLI